MSAERVPPKKLVARLIPRADLDKTQRQRMFTIYSKYYACISNEEFTQDLGQKDFVILLYDPSSMVLQGFSTLMHLNFTLEGQPACGVFSGDTVIEREYWGNSSLGRAFLGHLFRLQLRNFGRPVYWFLISKGYKTYLLMANHFRCHYPRYEEPTPAWAKAIMDAYGQTLFPQHYEKSSGAISFGVRHAHLQHGVADIDDALKRANPRIAFFAQVNPGWESGTELVCLARMELLLPLRYVLSAARKRLRRLRPIFSSGEAVPRSIP